MADIRIKDLATTASSAASDDFMALDGATNGTRKMSAANPSVTTLTTSGVIAPGGSVHGANGAVGNPSFAFLSDQNTGLYRIGVNNIGVAANGAKVLDIATTGLGITGTATISSSTAGSASAGALVVTGGLSAGNNGNASYFGGAVSATVSSGPTLQINNVGTDQPYIGFYRGGTIRSALQLFTDNDFRFYASNLSTYAAISAGAATFAGAVTGTNTLSVTSAANESACLITNTGTGGLPWYLFSTNNNSGSGGGKFIIYGGTTPATRLTIDNTGAATFAGAVTVGGALKLGNAYVGTVIVPTGYVTIQDSNGNTYKIAVSA